MPMYPYFDETSKKEVEVIRNFSDYDIPPTQEEAQMSDEEYKEAKWKRLISTGIRVTRGDNWSGSKGNWLILLGSLGWLVKYLPTIL